jgi:hypothetical protein
MQAHSTLSKDAEDAENAEKQQMEYVRNLMQREMTNFKNKRKKDSALPLHNKKPKTILAKEKEPVVKMMKETEGDVWFKSKYALDSNLLTAYNEGKTNVTEKRFILQSAQINDKITKQVIAFKGIFLKPGCLLYKNEKNQFFVGVKCVTCEKQHPRNLLFFNRVGKLEDLG